MPATFADLPPSFVSHQARQTGHEACLRHPRPNSPIKCPKLSRSPRATREHALLGRFRILPSCDRGFSAPHSRVPAGVRSSPVLITVQLTRGITRSSTTGAQVARPQNDGNWTGSFRWEVVRYTAIPGNPHMTLSGVVAKPPSASRSQRRSRRRPPQGQGAGLQKERNGRDYGTAGTN